MTDLTQEFHDKLIKVELMDLHIYKDSIVELLPLESTLQDARWHGEGNVLEHTQLTLSEAYKICQSIEDYIYRVNLYIAALLHDVGKPATTQTHENGKITAYGHEQYGVHIARDFLKKYFPEFDYFRREEILSLVEFHGHPRRLVDSESSVARFRRLSCEVNTEMVYNLEIADFLGRIAKDRESALSVVDAFKGKCQQIGVFGTPYTPMGINATEYGLNAIKWNILFDHFDEDTLSGINKVSELYGKTLSEFTLLVGPPASGKTTYRNKLTNVKVICMDDERQRLCGNPNDQSKNSKVFNNCFQALNQSLKDRENVIWDATSWTRKARRLLIDMARHNGAFVQIVHFDFPLEVLLERNRNREKRVPDDVVINFYKRMESPRIYEYDKLIVVDN